jgi:hypothetical protein
MNHIKLSVDKRENRTEPRARRQPTLATNAAQRIAVFHST